MGLEGKERNTEFPLPDPIPCILIAKKLLTTLSSFVMIFDDEDVKQKE